VIWLDPVMGKVAAAIEVEHSTSIYSGIVRMLDLAQGTQIGADSVLFRVAPDNRREDVRTQLRRPAFSGCPRWASATFRMPNWPSTERRSSGQ
jgi:type II restriction enzyme